MTDVQGLLVLLGATLGVVVGVGVWLVFRLLLPLARLEQRVRHLAPPGKDEPKRGSLDRLARVLDRVENLLSQNRAECEEARQLIEEQSHVFRSALDAFDGPVLLRDPELNVLAANTPAGEARLDQTGEEVAAQRMRLGRKAVAENRPLRVEVIYRRPDGGRGVIEIRFAPLRDGRGRLTGVLELLRDLTAQRRMEQQRERLEFVTNSTPDSMTMVGPDHTYQAVNNAYLKRVGKGRDQIIGSHLSRVWGTDTYENIIRPHLDAAFSGTEESYDSWFGFPGREQRYYQVTYTPCREADGSVTRVVVVSRDITDRHEAELALKEAREELEERVRERTGELTQANLNLLDEVKERRRLETRLTEAKEGAERASRAKSEFLANMSHEVRTPLSAIAGMAEIGRDTVDNDDEAHLFRTILSEAGGLMNVLNTVLDYSKIEADKMVIEDLSFNLRYLVEDTAAGFALEAQRKGLEIIAAIRPRAPENLIGDPGRLRQILVNLIGNAIKFTDKGEVSVLVDLAKQDEDGVLLRFEVQDTGIGIPPERHQAVFESFTQVDGSTSRTHGGTGLGTTIAKSLAQMMGGAIGLESEPGQGSLFWFTARFRLQDKPRATVSAEPDLPGLSILVVDDNPLSVRTLAEHIASWGAQATTARTSARALDLLAQAETGEEPFDIIITDLAMPDMDGFDLAREVRARREYDRIPIVILTGATMIGHGETCREIGIQAYLPKPVRREDLNRALRAVLAIGGDPAEKGEDRLVTKHQLAEARRPLARVLLVEDHPTNREVALRHLERLGLDALVAANGREAVDLFGRMAFDLVLMDIQMPVMDGFEATRALRAKEERVRRLAGEKAERRTPVLALTAHAGPQFRQRCLDAGMDDHLLKPLTRAVLEAVAAKWLPETILNRTESPEPEPEDGGAPMNIPRAIHEFNDDEPFLRSLTRSFLEQAVAQVGRMPGLVARGEAETLADEAHSIKGGAANLTAVSLAEAARTVEDLARVGNLNETGAALDTLAARLDELRAFAADAWPEDGPDPS